MSTIRKIEVVTAIENYINGNISDFSELYMLGTNNAIIRYLKKYLEIYPERSYEINLLIDNIGTLRYEKYERDNLINVLKRQIEIRYTNYAEVILNLLINNKNDGINYLKKNHITLKNLKSSLDKFKNIYINQSDEINYIIAIMNEYELERSKDNVKKTKYIDPSLFYDQKDKNNINNVFECLYLSNLSIEEFCSLKGETISITKTIVKSNLNDSSKADKAKEILSRIPSKEFNDKMISLAYEIDTNESFDALDYFETTRFKNSEFRDVISKLIDKKDLVRIVQKLNQKVKINLNINKTFELNSKKIISGREVTLEDKEKVFNYLEENNLPLGLYNVALKRYLNNNLKVLKK